MAAPPTEIKRQHRLYLRPSPATLNQPAAGAITADCLVFFTFRESSLPMQADRPWE